MNDSLNALLLGEYLVKYVYSIEAIPWESEEEVYRFYRDEKSVLKPLMLLIGHAVEGIIQCNHQDIDGCYEDLVDLKGKTRERFILLALQAAPTYFPNGYTAESFLCYCAMVVGVSRLCFCYPQNGIAESAAESIGLVLTSYMITREFQEQGGWVQLGIVSKMIADSIF